MNASEKRYDHPSAPLVLDEVEKDRITVDGGFRKSLTKRCPLEDVFGELDESPLTDGMREEMSEVVKLKAPLPVCVKMEEPALGVTQPIKDPVPRGIKCQQHVRNPWAVWTISDLFMLGGPLVSVFLICQVVAAILLARAVAHIWMWDFLVSSVTTVWGYILLDMVVFLFRRGRLVTGFIFPAVWVSLVTIAPGIGMQIWYYVAHWTPW